MKLLSILNYKRLKSIMLTKLINFLKLVYFCEVFNIVRRSVDYIKIKIKFNKRSVISGENYLKLHLGCGSINFPGYINLDFKKTIATDYVCNCTSLPLFDNTVELIETYHMIEHLSRNDFPIALKNWWKKLIPGGRLVIECSDFDESVKDYINGNEDRINNIFGLQRHNGDVHYFGYSYLRLKIVLESCGYEYIKKIYPQDYHRSEEPCMRIEAYKKVVGKNKKEEVHGWSKRMKKRPETLTIEWRKNHIHSKILYESKSDLFDLGKKCISFGCGTGELEVIMGEKGYSITGVDISDQAIKVANNHKADEKINNVKFIKASIYKLPFENNEFDSGYLFEVLEHIPMSDMKAIFSEIKRVLKPDSKFLITVPNKNAYFDSGHINFFTKGTLAKLIDDMDLTIDNLEFEERRDAYRKHDMLKIMVVNKNTSKITQAKKICCIGGFDTYGYNYLGFHWDGQARAFKELGYEVLFLDIRKDKNYTNLKDRILQFKPDILWLGLKDCIDFVKEISNDVKYLRKSGCKVVYWYCDYRYPEKNDLSNLVDVMFVSNSGQIEEYKMAYNLKKVYFMPQACTPSFMHRMELEKEYDISFAGSYAKNHRKRKKFLKKISKKYKLEVRNNTLNNISNFYSKSKIVIGMNVDFESYLYTSNRFYIALGCGAFYLCKWFPGIERLAENKKHLIWFRTEKELFNLINYYLNHDREREKIRTNAQKLAHSKHTYTNRIINMIDIIEEKADNFYGFIN